MKSDNMQRIIDEDAVGQLRRRDGRMAILGSEDGVLKLDWVEGIARLLADDFHLEAVEAEARDILQRGIRHIIWAGMGGSVMAVRVLTELGFCNEYERDQMVIYPLDSTDPAALNAIVRRVAHAKNLSLPAPEIPVDAAWLRSWMADVMMIGVSMGMTSEEPITHLEWFTDLLAQAGLLPAEHLLVMTLPGSYLDRFAREHAVPSRSLQLDGGTGTGGRMSAPTTRVFLLPAALYLTRLSDKPGLLRAMLQQAWDWYDLDGATQRPAEHPFVQLAAALSEASFAGICRLLLEMPPEWSAMMQWIEQLMEESLGKGGKGVVVFNEQPLAASQPGYTTNGMLHVKVVASPPAAAGPVGAWACPAQDKDHCILHLSYLANQEPVERLAALAASFLGWQLTMALYGYLQDITFAGQPAVENYKARARVLRQQGNPLAVIEPRPPQGGPLHVAAPLVGVVAAVDAGGESLRPYRLFQQQLATSGHGRPAYLDITVNGEVSPTGMSQFERQGRWVSDNLLGVPVKVRRAPAAYHSTEQSEMDGPPDLLSVRYLARHHQTCLIGTYDDTFLNAQAASTWQAMLEQGRTCYLLIVDTSIENIVGAQSITLDSTGRIPQS